MRFSLSVLGGCVVSSMENGRRGEKKKERKKESIARFEREGRMVVDRRRVYETRRSVFRVRVTGDFEFFPFF